MVMTTQKESKSIADDKVNDVQNLNVALWILIHEFQSTLVFSNTKF